MSEGERPPIPAHLREGLKSAGKYEIDALREYQIDNIRWCMRIAPENFEQNETIRRYVTVRRDAEAMVDRLRWPDLRNVVSTQTPLFDQLAQARRLYVAEKMVLAEGFEGRLAMSSLGSTLDTVVRRYGLRIWESPWSDPGIPDPRLIEPAELWTASAQEPMPSKPWKHPAGEHWWYWPDMPNERQDPEHMRALQHEPERQGIPGALAGFDPATHVTLSALVYGRELVRQTEELGGLPSALGLKPSALTRLQRVAGLNRLAIASVEEAIRPGRLSADEVRTGVAPVLEPYGLPIKRTRTPM